MAQSLVLSIDVCPGLGISPLQTNICLSFSQADLGPRSAQELFFSGFLKSLRLFFRRFALIASGTDIFRRACIFAILTFYGNIAFPLSPVLLILLFRSCFKPKIIPFQGPASSKSWKRLSASSKIFRTGARNYARHPLLCQRGLYCEQSRPSQPGQTLQVSPRKTREKGAETGKTAQSSESQPVPSGRLIERC